MPKIDDEQQVEDDRDRAETVAVLRKRLKEYENGEKRIPLEEVFTGIAARAGFDLR